MIIVVLKNPDPSDPERCKTDVEMRILIQGMTLEEADDFGEAIREFAVLMNREPDMKAYQLDNSPAMVN